MRDLVSIIMPNYNCEKFLDESIQSVLKQTYKNWELIIVDDCSSDGSLILLQKYADADSRIKLFVNDYNCGAAHSRNKALEKSSGRWVAFLDSDDIWDQNKLEKQIGFMEKNKCYFSYTNYNQIDEASKDLGVHVTGPRKISKFKMYQFDYIGCLTVIYDQTRTGKLYVDERLKCRNDYALWLKVSHFLTCFLLNEDLAFYRVRNNSISHSGIKKLIKSHYQMFRISEKKTALTSAFLTLRNMIWSRIKRIKYIKKQTNSQVTNID